MKISEISFGRATVAAVILAGAIVAVGALTPAASAEVRPFLQALGVISCNSMNACQEGKNAGSGPGLEGTSAQGTGVIGDTTLNTGNFLAHAGVVGRDKSSSSVNNVGVKGLSTHGVGVVGKSTGNIGVFGTSTLFVGVWGTSTTGVGVFGASSSNAAMRGISSSSFGVDGSSDTGTGVSGTSESSIGVFAKGGFVGNGDSIPALSVTGNAYNPDLIYACSLGGADPCTEFPGSPTPQFAVVNNGNVFITGQIFTSGFCSSGCAKSKSSGEKRVRMFTPQESLPTVEDFGQGQLVEGRAHVSIDPAFANTTDSRAAYMVFVTPEGDNRGLYVANKNPAGFDVRESQGGRSTLAFDYRIVAKPFGVHPARLRMITVTKPGMALPASSVQ